MRVVPDTADTKADALTLAVHCLLFPVGIIRFVDPVPSKDRSWDPPELNDESLLTIARDLCESPLEENEPADNE